MTYYEILKANKSFIQLLKKNGVVLTDVDMIQIYERYQEMCMFGYKKMYVMEKLAEEANITSRTLYVIVHRMEAEVVL